MSYRKILPTVGLLAAIIALIIKRRPDPTPETPIGSWVPTTPTS